MPNHHPEDDMLAEYAAGALPEATGLLVATHLTLCPRCRAAVAAFEAVGGALFETIGTDGDDAGLNSVLARLDEPETAPPPPAPPPAGTLLLPRPLRERIGADDVDALPWRRLSAAIGYIDVVRSEGGTKTQLLRLQPGTAVPRHGHDGTEYTLLLGGGMSDEGGHYRRGDLVIADTGYRHRPVADADADCICLVVEEGPLRFGGPMGWLYGFIDGRR